MLLVGGKTDPSSDRVSGKKIVVWILKFSHCCLDSKVYIFDVSLCQIGVVFVYIFGSLGI